MRQKFRNKNSRARIADDSMDNNSRAVERSELQKHWDNFAGVYASYFTPFTTVVQHGIIVHLQLATAKSVLEVGAGPGNSTKLLIDELTAKNQNATQCELVVTDFSAEMVKRLRQTIDVDPKCTENLPKSITVQQVDARKLPFSDGSFDRYLPACVFNLYPNTKLAFEKRREFYRKAALQAFRIGDANSTVRFSRCRRRYSKKFWAMKCREALPNFCRRQQAAQNLIQTSIAVATRMH